MLNPGVSSFWQAVCWLIFLTIYCNARASIFQDGESGYTSAVLTEQEHRSRGYDARRGSAATSTQSLHDKIEAFPGQPDDTSFDSYAGCVAYVEKNPMSPSRSQNHERILPLCLWK